MVASKTNSMTGTKGDDAIRAATGKTWAQWRVVLDEAGAAQWSHPDIARWVEEHFSVGGWWAQGVTVGYEQAIGRRIPGQRADGTFDVSASRTIRTGLLDALDATIAIVSDRLERRPDAESREVKMPNARWKLAGGERLLASVAPQKSGNVVVSLTHSKMDSPEALETARDRMKAWLAALE